MFCTLRATVLFRTTALLEFRSQLSLFYNQDLLENQLTKQVFKKASRNQGDQIGRFFAR
jgi:hypothetical protein